MTLFYGYTVQVASPPPVSPPAENNPQTAAIATQHTQPSLAVFLMEAPAPTGWITQMVKSLRGES